MGVASNKIKKTTRLINYLVCRKPRGGRPGREREAGREGKRGIRLRKGRRGEGEFASS